MSLSNLWFLHHHLECDENNVKSSLLLPVRLHMSIKNPNKHETFV